MSSFVVKIDLLIKFFLVVLWQMLDLSCHSNSSQEMSCYSIVYDWAIKTSLQMPSRIYFIHIWRKRSKLSLDELGTFLQIFHLLSIAQIVLVTVFVTLCIGTISFVFVHSYMEIFLFATHCLHILMNIGKYSKKS